jgi:hypothetical protein
MSNTTAPFAAVTSKLGVHAATTPHRTQRAAELAARKAIREGRADSAAVYGEGIDPLSYFGSGR